MFDPLPSGMVLPVLHTPLHQGATSAHLAKAPNGTGLIFSDGQEIYAAGDKAGALYQVEFGVVRLYRLLADGRRQICSFQMQGDVFGFDSGAERPFFADAVNAVGLKILRQGNEAELTQGLFKLAMRSLERAHDHLLIVGRNDAVGRVAAFLLEMAERQDSRNFDMIDLPMSRADIADYLGLTIETVSRVMTKLRTARIIRLTSARHLEVLRWEALEDMTS